MKLLLLLLVACNTETKPCTCKPANDTRSAGKIVELAKKHVAMTSEHRNARDVKMVDDELRLQMGILCQPCDYVGERASVEEMLPLADLAHATSAVCMGLVLDDGRTVSSLSCRPAP